MNQDVVKEVLNISVQELYILVVKVSNVLSFESINSEDDDVLCETVFKAYVEMFSVHDKKHCLKLVSEFLCNLKVRHALVQYLENNKQTGDQPDAKIRYSTYSNVHRLLRYTDYNKDKLTSLIQRCILLLTSAKTVSFLPHKRQILNHLTKLGIR